MFVLSSDLVSGNNAAIYKTIITKREMLFIKGSIDDLVGGLADGLSDLRVQAELDVDL